ncbi:MAG: formylglycine-generating enzyme family protein, partial [Thermoanaerobaculia bacterium]|nr:formylglycine-generating enzyme family protein [Thermoanaerobaculia bacterium]
AKNDLEIRIQKAREELDKPQPISQPPKPRPKTQAQKPKTNTGTAKPANVPPKPAMVFVAGGTFRMGDTFGEGGSGEQPVHDVTLGDFYISPTEVTFDEYDLFCQATGRSKPGDQGWGRGRRPVINVDWYDAIEYCNWLSRQHRYTPAYTVDKSRKDPNNTNTYDDKKWTVALVPGADGYRLPTEAEWEYAARGRGQKVRFGNGKNIADPGEINFDGSAEYKQGYSVAGVYRGKTVSAGSLGSPNALGLHDMSGNVWEWCWDWYDGKQYEKDANGAYNPTGAGSGQYRVVRGGSWGYNPGGCRAADRSGWYPLGRGLNFGFRVARH